MLRGDSGNNTIARDCDQRTPRALKAAGTLQAPFHEQNTMRLLETTGGGRGSRKDLSLEFLALIAPS